MRNYAAKILVVAILILVAFLSACSPNNAKSEPTPAATAAVNNSLKSSPELLVKGYYGSEVKGSEKELQQFFYKPENQDVSFIKEKISVFKVKSISLNKVVKQTVKGRLAVMTNAYNTYFEGIASPRKDLEVIVLIKNDDKWYILNTQDGLNTDEVNFINNESAAQNSDIWTDDYARKIIDDRVNFDDNNKSYMEEKQKELTDKINQSSSK